MQGNVVHPLEGEYLGHSMFQLDMLVLIKVVKPKMHFHVVVKRSILYRYLNSTH